MSFRGALCFRLSKAVMAARPPEAPTLDPDLYSDWRRDELVRTWSHFSRAAIDGKDVLDFGCGEGALSVYLARIAQPRSIIGVDICNASIERAIGSLKRCDLPDRAFEPRFLISEDAHIPLPDQTIDTIIAFDCMEHIMDPGAILAEWARLLRPGGRVLIEWFPFKGPWGAHMRSLVPIPWAPVLFGQRAMYEAAARIYDDPAYTPRNWDVDEHGQRRPNKFRDLRRVRDGGSLNELDLAGFRSAVSSAGFAIQRLECLPFGKRGLKRFVGRALQAIPPAKEYFTNFVIVEIIKPGHSS